MYLQKMLVLNSGATSEAKIDFPFHEDGRPKPVVIVGGNGTGKTNLLSIITDGFMELAQLHYQDALPARGVGYKYYRVSGGRTLRVGCSFDLTALRFAGNDKGAFVRCQSGDVPFDALTEQLEDFGPVSASNRSKEPKIKIADETFVETTFRTGVYTYFPSSRNELPYWLNDQSLESDPLAEFPITYSTTLGKPFVLERGIQALKPWIIDILLDQSADTFTALKAISEKQGVVPLDILNALQQGAPYQNLNMMIQEIVGEPQARIVRLNRIARDRRIQIYYGLNPGLPTLDSLSAGQATLFSIFGNTLRLGTWTERIAAAQNATGIVLVDEIDAHLHANLAFDALPKLIAMFPKVQFIMTCHSPLLPLGMEKRFGKDGFQILEMPSATPISAERYSEFLQSLKMYEATKAFEERLREVGKGGKPIVIGEGETDPLYLTTAAALLGYQDVLDAIDITWIGALDQSEKKTGGQDQLEKTLKIYRSTPALLNRKVLCVFDQKSKGETLAIENLFAFKLPLVSDHPYCNDGPENLLPPELFEAKFYRQESWLSGATRMTKNTLHKTQFAEHVCNDLRDPQHFEKFAPLLDEIRSALGLNSTPQPSQP